MAPVAAPLAAHVVKHLMTGKSARVDIGAATPVAYEDIAEEHTAEVGEMRHAVVRRSDG